MPTGGRLIVALGLILAGCSVQPSASPSTSADESAATSVAPTLPAFADEALYHPSAEAVAAAAPGEIIESIEIRSAPGTRAWFVVHGSTGLDGEPVAVSGMIVAPDAPPAAGDGYPIVAWAHGTSGIADDCSPSHGGIVAVATLLDLAADGYVVTATDYEGLGTDGVHPYLVGISEGRAMLDSIRAAMELPDAHAGTESVAMGFSQGGHATLWAAELQPTYAPDLALLGAFAASPPTDMVALGEWAFDEAATGNVNAAAPMILIFGVWNVLYDAPLDFLTDAGQALAMGAPDGCFPNMPNTTPYVSDAAQIAEWRDLLAANSPGAVRTDVPIRVVAAEDDESVDYATLVSGVVAMCAIGDTLELVTVPGGHDSSIRPSSAWDGAVSWIGDRFAAVPAISTCAP